MVPPDECERLLKAAAGDNKEAWAKLLPLIYGELRRLANHLMAGEPAGQTLQPTALVHEAYLKLMHQPGASWVNKRHFFNAAAQAMRRIMIDRARYYKRGVHGGGGRREQLDPDLELRAVNIPALKDFSLDAAEQLDLELTELEKLQPRWAEVVRLMYFAGLTQAQAAEAMGLAERTVREDWRFARAWLMSRVGEQKSQGGTPPVE